MISALIVILIVVNIAVPLLLVRKRCVSKKGIQFDHFLLFTCGFLVYWILPIMIGMLRLYTTKPAMGLWYSIFDSIKPLKFVIYLLTCLACYLCFWVGSVFCAALMKRRVAQYQRIFFDIRLLNIYLVFGIIAAMVYAYLLRGQLFKGYTDFTDVETRGTFTATSTFLMSLAFTYSTKLDEVTRWILPFRRLVANPFFGAYFIVAILVSSMGGRLYLLSGIIMLVVYNTVFYHPLKLHRTVVLVAGALTVVGAIGLARQGIQFDPSSLLLNLAVEPIFNSFSLIYFLGHANLEIIRFPIFLISSFINLIPTALFPAKANFIIDPSAYGYVAFAPIGALNSFFSFMINFGVVGTMFVLFLFSGFLQYLKAGPQTVLTKTIYVMISGWIATTFFRDPFSISIVKAIFQFSILTPTVLVLSVHVISQILSPRRHAAATGHQPEVIGGID